MHDLGGLPDQRPQAAQDVDERRIACRDIFDILIVDREELVVELVGYALFELFVFLQIAFDDLDQVVGEGQTSRGDGGVDGLGKLLEGPDGIILVSAAKGSGRAVRFLVACDRGRKQALAAYGKRKRGTGGVAEGGRLTYGREDMSGSCVDEALLFRKTPARPWRE